MVKKGYKQTEVGVLPEDWAIKKLINLSDGGMQNGTFYEGSRKGTGVYFLNVGNLYQAAPIIPQTLGKFDASKDEIDRFRVKNGDLFFTRSSIVPSGIAYCNWYNDSGDNTTVFDSHVVRFKTDTDQVNPMYLYLQCVSQESRKYFISNAKVATMTTIDQAQIGNCLIPVPSLTEQKNIAEAISDADRIIRLLEKLIIKKKAIKQGAMQELLTGKRRLPGFSEEWQNIVLGTVSSFYNGGTPSKTRKDWWSGNIPWISSSDLSESTITSVKISRFVSQEAVARSATRICPRNAVLIVSRVGVGKVAVSPCELCTSQDFTTIVSSRHNPYFLAYMLMPIMKKLAIQSQGTSIKGITTEDIQIIAIPTPSEEEQNAIVDILADTDSEIEALEQKLKKYRQVKQSMMQQLLTGKIRLV